MKKESNEETKDLVKDIFADPDINSKPLTGLDKYPEFKKVVNDITMQTIRSINNCSDIVQSEMPYKNQFILEMVIQELEKRV